MSWGSLNLTFVSRITISTDLVRGKAQAGSRRMNLMFIRNRPVFAALAALVLSFSGVIARAQSSSPKREDGITIVGTVRDEQGTAVAGAADRLIGDERWYSLKVKNGPGGTVTT